MMPDFRYKDPERTEITSKNIVLEDIVDAIATKVSTDLHRYEIDGASLYAGIAVQSINKTIKLLELFRRRLLDHRGEQNRERRQK